LDKEPENVMDMVTPPRFSIGAVERDTGLSKDTLRVWEKRYGFPTPERDDNGERVYSAEQVEKLRIIKRLVDRGHRPSKIIGASLDALREMVDPVQTAPDPLVAALQPVLALVREHRVAELRQRLHQTLITQGLASFFVETVAPLNTAVGDAWMRGQLEVFEEHLYTETLQGVLRNAIASIPRHNRPPRILLTTVPNEQHILGLLMAEGMFALEGATTISLGTQTPIWDIVQASATQKADVVALSFSAAFPANIAAEALEELRDQLPAQVSIWAGGANPALQRRPIEGVMALPDLRLIPAHIAQWRADRAA
jgi:DNA-binding transcriptional MerR regulator/methylmalonyl-CoA mutase cobalamin-binding subunit